MPQSSNGSRFQGISTNASATDDMHNANTVLTIHDTRPNGDGLTEVHSHSPLYSNNGHYTSSSEQQRISLKFLKKHQSRIGDEIYSTVLCIHDSFKKYGKPSIVYNKNANPLALVATAQTMQDPYYQTPKHHKSYAPTSNAPTSKASLPTRSHAATRYKGKEIAKPITPPSESASKQTEFGHYAKECTKPKWVKDSTYHKEKMLLCKQAEKGVQLQAEQSDWLADTDEEIDEQELEAHYSYMAKIQEVPNADSGTDTEPLEQIVQLILFIVDSGCTKHMTGNLSLMCNFVEKYLGTVRFGNDQFAPILSYGDLVQGNITINRVCYVEGLNHNLFSVG
ncbi:hypothetical protein Tco_1514853 [Tanacetum coccineum]